MAQSNLSLVDFASAEEYGYTFERQSLSAPDIIEAYSEFELLPDDICAEINYGWGDSFRIVALKNASVLIFWLLDSSGGARVGWNDERDMPNSLVLPITQRNLDAAGNIKYDEYDNPVFDDFLADIEYFD